MTPKALPAPELVPIDSLHLDPANARKHGQRNLDGIKASLARFEQPRPILAGTNRVVRAGNGTLMAARELGWTHINVLFSDLSPSELTAYALTDNRTAETSEWDYQALGDTIRSLQEEEFDVSVLGWLPHELEPLLAADWSPASVQELPGQADDDDRGSEGDDDPEVIRVTARQRELIDPAILRVRTDAGDPTVSEGACLARICDEFTRVNP